MGKSNLQKTSRKKFRILQRKANMRKKTPKKRKNLQKLAINGNDTEISNFFKTLRNRVKRWPYWFERQYLRASKRVESMKSKSNDEKTDSFDSSYSYLSKGVGEFALFCPNVDYRVAKLKKITKDLETLKECKQELKDNCPHRELPSGWKEGEICLRINDTYLKQHDAAVDKALKDLSKNAVEYFDKAIQLNKDWVKMFPTLSTRLATLGKLFMTLLSGRSLTYMKVWRSAQVKLFPTKYCPPRLASLVSS